MTDCIFCKILAGDVPASMVYRDKLVAAFMDIQPVTSGHVLVVPVRHAAFMAEVKPEESEAMMRVAHQVNAALRASSLPCEGVNYLLGDGEAAMQEVLHAHLHVFPRVRGDGFGLRFSQEYYERRPAREQLDAQAAELKKLLTR